MSLSSRKCNTKSQAPVRACVCVRAAQMGMDACACVSCQSLRLCACVCAMARGGRLGGARARAAGTCAGVRTQSVIAAALAHARAVRQASQQNILITAKQKLIRLVAVAGGGTHKPAVVSSRTRCRPGSTGRRAREEAGTSRG